MRFVAFGLAMLLCASAAQAQDIFANSNIVYGRALYARAQSTEPTVQVLHSSTNPALLPSAWRGFYVGGFGAYASQDNTSAGFPSQKGPFGGATLGFQWQWDRLIAGIEADGGWGDISATASRFVFPATVTLTSRTDETGTIRGRIGATFDRVLIYGTGGLAWAVNRISATAVLGPFAAGISDRQGHLGWTAGGGVEVMFAPRWSVKGEYLYRSFGSEQYFSTLVAGGLASGPLTAHSVQVGVNFHF